MRIAAILGVLGLASGVSAQLAAYSDRSAWEVDPQVGAVEVQGFTGIDIPSLQPSGGPVLFDGVTLTVEGTDSTTGSPAITGGLFQGSIFPATGHVAYHWDFDAPVSAFGADFFGAATGLGIRLEAAGELVDIFTFYSGFQDGFLGFTTATPVTRVSIIGSDSAGGTAVGEIFDMDDLSWSVADTTCYADCDASGALDFFDFLCFQNAFATGEPYADCDGSGTLDFFDFLCFQNEFAAGCP
ncbi:MAG: GC-type dockerin domain-anchored protein [Phycisphaerales bacterium JB039]